MKTEARPQERSGRAIKLTSVRNDSVFKVSLFTAVNVSEGGDDNHWPRPSLRSLPGSCGREAAFCWDSKFMSECTHPYLKKNTKSKSRLTLVLLTVDKTDSPFSQPSSLGGPLTKFFLSLMNPEEKGEGGGSGWRAIRCDRSSVDCLESNLKAWNIVCLGQVHF